MSIVQGVPPVLSSLAVLAMCCAAIAVFKKQVPCNGNGACTMVVDNSKYVASAFAVSCAMCACMGMMGMTQMTGQQGYY